MFVEDKAMGEGPSLNGFIDFCRSRDPDEKYHWTSSHECACAQYLKSIGQFTMQWVGSSEIMGKLNRIAGGATESYDLQGYKGASWTFGQCLERAKKVKELA